MLQPQDNARDCRAFARCKACARSRRARNDDAVRQRLRAPLIAHELRRLLDAGRRRGGLMMSHAAALPVRLVNSACRCPSRDLPARHDDVALCNRCVRVNSGNAGARTSSQSNNGGNARRELHRRELHELLTRASRALLAHVPPSISLVRTGTTSRARALGVGRRAQAQYSRIHRL